MAETEIKKINGRSIADETAREAAKNSIKYTEQTLTDAQKAQAISNIGAVTKSQGVDNAGKILGIDDSGNVVPEDKPVQALAGAAAPSTATAGVVGQEYYVIVDNAVTEMYVCTSALIGSYTWDKVEFGGGEYIAETAPVDSDANVWNDFKNFAGYDPATTPVQQEVNGELRAGMITATGRGRWNSTQSSVKTATGDTVDMSTTNFVDGGHVFEGWDATHTYRFTMLIGKFSQGRAHIFTFKPQSSGVEVFGSVWIGSDHQYKGIEITPTYAQMWGNFTSSTFSGINNWASTKYYGGVAGADRATPLGAHIEITANNNTTPNRIRMVNSTGVALPVLASDPENLEDGLAWINSTDKKMKYVVGGVTYSIQGTVET